jgi:RimJ/RimL family protein N-acetyltransferase
MERMPYQAELDATVISVPAVQTTQVTSTDWQAGLPTLCGKQVVLRELRASDAPSLFALLTTEEVSRFISPPPSTVEGFERFIAWTIRQRSAGTYACFAVTLQGSDTAIGIFQVRQLDLTFRNAEWGFAIGSQFWGTGVFQASAELVLNFAFETIGVCRLEARAAVLNGRGNGALRKLGAVQEAILRKSFRLNGQYLDQVLYTIIDEDWLAAGRITSPESFGPIRSLISTALFTTSSHVVSSFSRTSRRSA